MKSYLSRNIIEALEHENKNVIEAILKDNDFLNQTILIKCFCNLSKNKQESIYNIKIEKLNFLIIKSIIENSDLNFKIDQKILLKDENINIFNNETLLHFLNRSLNYKIITTNKYNLLYDFFDIVNKKKLEFDIFKCFTYSIDNSDKYFFEKIFNLIEISENNSCYFDYCLKKENNYFVNYFINKCNNRKLLHYLNEFNKNKQSLFLDNVRDNIEKKIFELELKDDINNSSKKSKRKI